MDRLSQPRPPLRSIRMKLNFNIHTFNESTINKIFLSASLLLVFLIYNDAINNYFTFDDFYWLSRSNNFTVAKMFIPEPAGYFDPIIHILFLLNYKISGFDYRFYHITDIILHCANVIFVYRLTKLITNENITGIYSAILFGCSFAISDAALVP